MPQKVLKFFLFLIPLLLYLFLPNLSLALEAGYPSVFGLSLGDDPSLPEYARYFFNIGILLACLLAVIVIAWGGIQYMFTLGIGKLIDPKKGTRAPDEAKERIKAGILGLLIVVGAYLIAYTINPYLVIFDLRGLAPLSFIANLFNPSPSPSLPVEVYNEIPIGTLAENLIAREISCYNFEGRGDPVPGKIITTDGGREIYSPTYLEHDRADCIQKIAEAIDKKSKIAEQTAKEIADQMAKCSCAKISTCGSGSESSQGGNCKSAFINDSGNPIEDNECDTGKANQGTCESIKKPCESQGENCERCASYVKDAIEDGLSQFRTRPELNNNYSAIKNFVEVQPQPKLNNKELWIIDTGADKCGTCDFDCPVCQPNDAKCLSEKQRCKQGEEECKDRIKNCLKENSRWAYLPLIDQLTYLKGKMDEIKEKLKTDLKNLEKGEAELQKCYLAESYVDFLKIYEKTDKKNKTVVLTTSFRDNAYGNESIINPAKYCEGYQYANSNCYSQCQKQCPGTTEDDFACYSRTPNCDEAPNPAAKKECQKIIKQECYDKRACLPDLSPFKNFSECMADCQLRCASDCQGSASSVKDEENCIKNCSYDSKCLQDNEEVCIVNFGYLRACSSPEACITTCDGNESCEQECNAKYNNLAFKKNCVETSAYLCQYCSDQNAGYPDCVKSAYYSNDEEEYSSSFLYKIYFINKNPGVQVCNNPNQLLLTSQGYTLCQSLYPETAKCPSASKCPVCPCGIIYEDTGEAPAPKPSSYRACSGTCDNYAFNDDPLTFYCNQTWWEKQEAENQKPLGDSFVCKKEQEIPVGNTVDDSEKWANEFIEFIEGLIEKTEELTQYLDEIGQKKDYCKCDSRCGEQGAAAQEFMCLSKCTYSESSGSEETGDYTPSACTPLTTCAGNPCQFMINLLLGKAAETDCPKGESFAGVAAYVYVVSLEVKKVKGFIEQSNRSDILKELEYSRKMVNTCGQNYPKETRALSCTRVEDEIIPPIIGSTSPGYTIINGERINSYCYGKEAGKISGAGELADNWFCCQAK